MLQDEPGASTTSNPDVPDEHLARHHWNDGGGRGSLGYTHLPSGIKVWRQCPPGVPVHIVDAELRAELAERLRSDGSLSTEGDGVYALNSSDITTDLNPYQPPGSLIDRPSASKAEPLRVDVEVATWMVLGVAALPLAILSVVYVFAFRASLFLGRWPYYGHPDPKDLPDNFHPSTEWLALAGPVATFAIQLLVARLALGRRRWRLLIAAALIPATWLLCYVLTQTDPGGVFDWFFD